MEKKIKRCPYTFNAQGVEGFVNYDCIEENCMAWTIRATNGLELEVKGYCQLIGQTNK